MFRHLEVCHAPVAINNELRHYPALHLLRLGGGRIAQVLRKPLHKLSSTAWELWQILDHTDIHRLVVHIDHLWLLLLIRILRRFRNLCILRCELWGYFHVVLHQSQVFRLGRLRCCFLWQHHGYLVLIALQGFQFEFGLKVVIFFEESPARAAAVPFQRHEEQCEHENESQEEPLHALAFQIGLTTFLLFHNKSGFLPFIK